MKNIISNIENLLDSLNRLLVTKEMRHELEEKAREFNKPNRNNTQ